MLLYVRSISLSVPYDLLTPNSVQPCEPIVICMSELIAYLTCIVILLPIVTKCIFC